MARFYLFITLIFSNWDRIILDEYYCSYYPDLFVDTFGCKNYMCWESQLTDRNRDLLTTILNNYRSNVALGMHPAFKGSYYQPMFKLNYHWQIEERCIEWLQKLKCTLPLPAYITPRPIPSVDDIPEFSGSLAKPLEEHPLFSWIGGICSIKLEYNDFLDDVIQIIEDILLDLDNTKHFLNSWTRDGKYKYGVHSFYGCAIMIANNMTGETDFGGMATNDRVAFVSCLFLGMRSGQNTLLEAEPVKDLSDKRCEAYVVEDSITLNRKTGLCDYKLKKFNYFNLPCQIYYNTNEITIKRKCVGEVPQKWSQFTKPNARIDKIIIKHQRNKPKLESDVQFKNLQSPIKTTKSPATTSTKIITTLSTTPTTTPTQSTTPILTNPYPDDKLSDYYCDDLSLFCNHPLLIFFILCVVTIVVLFILFKVYSVRFQ